MTNKPTLFDLCVHITGKFEGHGYTSLAGNFDGMGLSAGYLQWNLGSGTLQNFILNHINPMSYEFPLPIDHLTKITPAESVVWAKDVMLDADGSIKPEWKDAWVTFLSNPYVINVQKNAINKYYHRAKELSGKFGYNHSDRRSMAYFFDTAVQSWSLEVPNPEPNIDRAINCMSLYNKENFAIWAKEQMDDKTSHMIILAHLRAMKSKEEWREKVFSRRATIAFGIGIVNRTLFNFKKLY